ncbi:MAG: hypothetical protein K5774_08480 [Clostridia bacterium]|nr:hypothetical protein [Clostridia bacterium]
MIRLERLLNALPAADKARPDGYLRVNLKKNGATYYFESKTAKADGASRIIQCLGSGNSPAVRAVKLQRFNREYRRRLTKNIKALRMALRAAEDFGFDDIVRALPAAYQVETDCYSGVLRFAASGPRPEGGHVGRAEGWMSERYAKNPAEMAARHITITGEAVRSKSEVIIYDLLVKYGVPFRYECALRLRDFNGLEAFRYPDFTILLGDGSLLYWEHLGMLSDERYLGGTASKLALYHRNGLTVGDNLILTSDAADGSINAEAIARIIEDLILPRL